MKLIFVDIDGTLTIPGENTPPESAVKAIRAAQEKGNKVFLSTGRNPAMLAPLLKYGFDGVVACAGGYVVCHNKVLFDCPMTEEQKNTALKTLHEHGVFCTIEAADGTWGDENIGDFLAEQGNEPGANSEIERWRKALSDNLGIRPMSEYDGRPIYKIVIMCLSMDQLQAAKDKLEKDFNFVMQMIPAHGCINGELVNRKFDKGTGVKIIAEHYGVPLSDTIGFGDSMNDVEMLETVGVSVCMENGAPPVKKISQIICPPVDEDGLARAFADLDLI